MSIKNRIQEFRVVPKSMLLPNPKNWRTHPEAQRAALRGVLAEVGIADAVIARELPDGRLMLVDGHLRLEELPDDVPTLVLDVNEAEADKLLASMDPLAAMADADAAKLDELLRGVQTAEPALADMFTELAEEAGVVNVHEAAPKSSTEEIDTEQFELGCKCPRCGFEFDPPSQA